MRRICFYHAGCPDGFGAAWAVWRGWDGAGEFVPRGHDDPLDASGLEGDQAVFVDIAPPNELLLELADVCSQVVVLDHHLSSRNRYERDPAARRAVEQGGHRVVFDLEHSGAVLAWRHFGPDEPTPDLLLYVEDQDLWRWKLTDSAAVNAAIASYPRTFDAWSELSRVPPEQLAVEGAPIVRAERVEVMRALSAAHPIALGPRRAEAVNATHARSSIGHELAKRASFERPWGCVYRVVGDRVDVSIYSIGELDVSRVAQEYGGGGHRNAAGFSVPLERWLADFL